MPIGNSLAKNLKYDSDKRLYATAVYKIAFLVISLLSKRDMSDPKAKLSATVSAITGKNFGSPKP